MNYKQLKFGLLCVAIVGCAVGLPIKAVADNGISIREDRLEYPEIKLTKIFGINAEVLADTNRYPVSSSRWHEIDLPEDMGGFRTVEFALTDDKGKFGICNATMTKVLLPEADDGKLLEEFRSAVDIVGKPFNAIKKFEILTDYKDKCIYKDGTLTFVKAGQSKSKKK